ncbi:MAG: Spy/CpxP family protein refolding chaperone [Nitrospinales bacterium]
MQSIKANRFILLSSALLLAFGLIVFPAFVSSLAAHADAQKAKGSSESSMSMPKPMMSKKEGSGSKAGSHGLKHGGMYKGHGKSHGHGGGHHFKGHGYGHGHDPFRHVLKFRVELGLTAEQLVALKNQKFEFKKSQIRRQADHQIAHMDLNRLVHAETIDEGKVLQLADQIGEIKKSMIKAGMEARIAIMKTLTAEQRKKVSAMFSQYN